MFLQDFDYATRVARPELCVVIGSIGNLFVGWTLKRRGWPMKEKSRLSKLANCSAATSSTTSRRASCQS
ncbi:MAG TPA: hypothetical protein VGR53_03970, partial [Nitrososphaerales archaeon]|nr:hypothetical protein [Nitrososphaerales archaeon]